MSRMADAAIAIPGMIADFLERRSTVGVAATRDRERRPRAHHLSGWRVADEGRELLCLVGRGFTAGLLEGLREFPAMAVTVEEIGPHETYQFKGVVVGSRPAEPSDREIWERLRARFSAAVQRVDPHFGLTDRQLRDFIPPPELALRLALREIFLQTPGPGAGRRLVPPPEQP